jgi:hypothetical protein
MKFLYWNEIFNTLVIIDTQRPNDFCEMIRLDKDDNAWYISGARNRDYMQMSDDSYRYNRYRQIDTWED